MKREPFAVGNQPVGELEGLEPDLWRGVSLSKAKPWPSRPISTRPPSKPRKRSPPAPDRRAARRGGRRPASAGFCEEVQDVGQDQLLMLFLDAPGPGRSIGEAVVAVGQEPVHGLVHMAR